MKSDNRESPPIPANESLTLDDLPQYSPWPARLLGLEPWSRKPRDRADLVREYEREKWGPLLAKAEDEKALKVEKVEEWELGEDRETIISTGDAFRLMRPTEARLLVLEQVAACLTPYLKNASAVVELGCGYGNVLLRLARLSSFRGVRLMGGELMESGVKLAQRLADAAGIDAVFGKCDLEASPIAEFAVPPGALVYTCFAVPCVPQLRSSFVDALVAMRPKAVVHIEPCYEHCDPTSLLGLLRRRYIEFNDYNRNLVSVLREQESAGRVKVLAESRPTFAQNPLLPASTLAWAPA